MELAQRDAAADDEKASKVAIREALKPRMEAWQKGKQVGWDSGLRFMCVCVAVGCRSSVGAHVVARVHSCCVCWEADNRLGLGLFGWCVNGSDIFVDCLSKPNAAQDLPWERPVCSPRRTTSARC